MEETLIQKYLTELRKIQYELNEPFNSSEKYIEIKQKLDALLNYGESRFYNLKCEDFGEK